MYYYLNQLLIKKINNLRIFQIIFNSSRKGKRAKSFSLSDYQYIGIYFCLLEQEIGLRVQPVETRNFPRINDRDEGYQRGVRVTG